MKRIIAIILALTMCFAFCACGSSNSKGSSIPEELAGRWKKDSLFAVFPFDEIDIESDGSCIIYMDSGYKGHITEKGGKYQIIVDDFSVSGGSEKDLEEVKEALKFTAVLDGDALTISVKAKSGYVYLGKDSLQFVKKK
ncbi:MAG: hypothetical protein K5771_01070 [Oscillospiraceae bacterium]|nr:hypothetical protein [Oscillospiraceae bacterium]